MSISKQKSFVYRPNFQWRFWTWPVGGFEICLPNQLHTAWMFVKCKCPNSYSVLCTVYEGNKIVRIPFNKLPCFENSSHKSLSSPSNSPAESPSSAGSVSPTTAIIPTSYYRWYFLRYRHFWSVIVIFDRELWIRFSQKIKI